MMSGIRSVDLFESYDTIYPADTVEWCPILEYNHVFVCGTYKLDQETKAKTGTINLFILDDQNKIKLIQSVPEDAVSDLKWNPQIVSGKILLAAALSGKHISVYSLDKKDTELCLSEFSRFDLPKTDGKCPMSLSVAWSRYENGTQSLAFSDSCGYITVVNMNNQLIRSFKAHNFDAWVVAFNYGEPNIFYTGGDDTMFKCYDQRLQFDKPVFETKEHKEGITTCSSNIIRENIIATGSYDGIVRLWDTRNIKSYNNVKVDGGVWRLKWEPLKEEYLLSASMFNAAHIIDTSNNEANICQEFGEKTNRLFYGADWSRFNSNQYECRTKSKNRKIIATCSFYDHRLDLFYVNIE